MESNKEIKDVIANYKEEAAKPLIEKMLILANKLDVDGKLDKLKGDVNGVEDPQSPKI